MAAHQAPLSLGFSRQEYWSGLPFPSPMQESEKCSRDPNKASPESPVWSLVSCYWLRRPRTPVRNTSRGRAVYASRLALSCRKRKCWFVAFAGIHCVNTLIIASFQLVSWFHGQIPRFLSINHWFCKLVLAGFLAGCRLSQQRGIETVLRKKIQLC